MAGRQKPSKSYRKQIPTHAKRQLSKMIRIKIKIQGIEIKRGTHPIQPRMPAARREPLFSDKR